MSGVGGIFDLTHTVQKAKRIIANGNSRNNFFLDCFDWRPWIQVELDHILSYSSKITADEEDHAMMGDVGIPTELLTRAKNAIRRDLEGFIRQGIGPVREFHHYECDFLNVDVYGEVYNLRVIDQGDYRVAKLQAQVDEEFVPDDFDGYVPERLRRANNMW